MNGSEDITEPPNYEDLDFSQADYPLPMRNAPPWEIGLKAVFYAVIIAFSLLGNSLIIMIVYRHKRMRTTTNFYIVNLAVADLMVTVSCTWVHFVDDITEGWVLGAFFCKFNSFSHVLSLVASVLTLTLIAYDRFFGIVFAMKAHMSERKAKTSIIIVWLCSVIIGSPILVFRKLHRRQWKNHLEQWCDDEGWPIEEISDPSTNITTTAMPWRTAYYTGITVVLFFMPMVVMAIAYSVIIWTLKTQTAPGENVPRNNSGQNRARKKVIFMLVVILFVFAICWFPFQICLFYTEHREKTQMGEWYPKFEFVARYLAYCNSALNPLIYAGFNDNFKQGLWTILGKSPRKPSFTCVDGKSYGTYSTTAMTLAAVPGSDGQGKSGLSVTAV